MGGIVTPQGLYVCMCACVVCVCVIVCVFVIVFVYMRVHVCGCALRVCEATRVVWKGLSHYNVQCCRGSCRQFTSVY